MNINPEGRIYRVAAELVPASTAVGGSRSVVPPKARPAEPDLFETGYWKSATKDAQSHVVRLKPTADYVPHWFAVFTSPRHEKRVAQHFTARSIEFYLPLYHPTHQWKHRGNIQLDLPLFPSYLFVRIAPRERMRVLPVPGVLNIVGTNQELSSVPDEYIDSIRAGLDLCKIEPHPYLTVGERVRIIKGPLIGMEGILLRKKNEFRVVITLEMICQSVVLEIDTADLETVEAAVMGRPLQINDRHQRV